MQDFQEIAARLARVEAKLDMLLGIERPPEIPIAEEMLEPCVLADRLGIGEPYVRKLCSRARREGVAGVEKVGGRWRATVEAIEALRRV